MNRSLKEIHFVIFANNFFFLYEMMCFKRHSPNFHNTVSLLEKLTKHSALSKKSLVQNAGGFIKVINYLAGVFCDLVWLSL